MRRTPTQINALMLVAVLAGITAPRPADAGSVTPISQQRSVSVLANAPQCNGDFLFDDDAAKGFDPFNSTVFVVHDCPGAFAFALGSQQSHIDANSMTAFGRSFAQVFSNFPESGVATHAIAGSFFEVTFELASASNFTLDGVISAEVSEFDVEMSAGANILLIGPAQRTIFVHAIDLNPGDEPDSLPLEESGILDPGVYTLRATAGSGFDAPVPPGGPGEAVFDFSIEFSTPGDLDGDGAVGILDLLILISMWGPCPAPPGECPADLDGNGTVGIPDLLTLLANWG